MKMLAICSRLFITKRKDLQALRATYVYNVIRLVNTFIYVYVYIMHLSAIRFDMIFLYACIEQAKHINVQTKRKLSEI